MKSIFVSLAIFFGLSVSVWSNDQRFHYFFSGYSGGNYSMVSCDYAEYRLQDLLTTLGATGISTTCNGGIDPWGNVRPISVSAFYSLEPLEEGAPTKTVDYYSDPFTPSCAFGTGMVRQLIRQTPSVKIIRESSACFSPQDSFSYRFRIGHTE